MAIAVRKAQMMAANEEKTFEQAREDFLLEKWGSNCSDSTLATYKNHLKYFFDNFISNNQLCKNYKKSDWTFFTLQITDDADKNDVTAQSYCRTVRAFLYWLMDNDYMPYFKIQIPRAQKKIKVTYSDEELKVLLSPPSEDCSYSKYQTWVFINFMIATGLRLSSALSIQTKDYIPQDCAVIVQNTKNNIGQTKYLNADVCTILNTYIKKFQLSGADYLFCVSSGGQMSRRAMEDNVTRYNKSLGVEKTSIHLFRHTFARKFLESGGTVIDLQRLLDHADINTTMQYVRDYSIDINKTREIFNPQARYSHRAAKAGNRKRTMK